MEDQPRPALPAWRTCLDIEAQSAEHYLDHWNAPLLEMVEQPPRRVLELGCAAGMFGAKLKEKFPGAHVTGVDAGRAAAAKAATRLDRVVTSRLENLDLAAEGAAHGEFDLVIAADILEHLVNPWEFLVRLRPYMAAGGVLLSSMPNVRNLNLVMDLLVNGRWRYAERGILDVTHLRFFTLEEMRIMFVETGYAPQGFTAIFSPSLVEAWEKYQGTERLNLSSGRVTIEGVSRAELAELCAEQFLMRSLAA
jgi:2-polyprenyl-3-methyl-5-hydroxy-6-metoxy-1,4-benzoquinol methylase